MFAELVALSDTAAAVAEIGSEVRTAGTAAAHMTTGIAAAATDEVSVAAARLFSAWGAEFHHLLTAASGFPETFARTVLAAAENYATAESANIGALACGLDNIGASLGGMPDMPAISHTLTATLQPSLLTGTTSGVILGGTWMPIPSASYVNGVLNYINQRFAVLPANAQTLVSPEQAYPITGVKSLTFGTSVSLGLQIMDGAIKQQLAANPHGSIAILGFSQSAVIASLEMRNLANPALNPAPPGADQLGFTLLGDPMNPNGGLFARFPGLNLPSIGLTLYGATPADTIYPTDIYTLEYDGFADFPQYPINVVADLNALMGLYYVHPTYASLDPASLPAGYTAHLLPTSPGYAGNTTYHMIAVPNLPLLEPLRSVPVLGNPLADLLQPDLRTIVNLGYGSADQGWSMSYADVPTEFGLLPAVDPGDVASHFITGTRQGVEAVVSDIRAAGGNGSPAALSQLLPALPLDQGGSPVLPTVSPHDIFQYAKSATDGISDAVSRLSAKSYSLLLPAADITNALIISIPSYDLKLSLDGIERIFYGDPADGFEYAVLAPIAADTALVPLAFGFGLIAVAWEFEYV